MIDIHTHLLPEVDDGSKSLAMSKKMLEAYAKYGIDQVVLTPHQNKNHQNKEELKAKFIEFCEYFKDSNIKFYLGSEIYYYEDLVNDLKQNKHLTINDSKYVLVEFSTISETKIADFVYDLVVLGFKPIIAHIERYEYLSKKDYLEIKQNGALIQVNSKSFEKKDYLKRLKFLLKNNLIDFIASDCHNDEKRNVNFDAAMKIIQKKYCNQYEKLFNNHLECV